MGVVPGVSIPGCCDCWASEVEVCGNAAHGDGGAADQPTPREAEVDEAPYCGAEDVFACDVPPRIFCLSPGIGTRGEITFKIIFFVRHAGSAG